MNTPAHRRATAAGLVALGLVACSVQNVQKEPAGPGFGEIMASIGARHAKLWFAGQAGNWPLMAYEIDELREGLEDVGKFHPTHKTVPGSVPRLTADMMDGPLDAIELAVKAGDKDAFAQRYDALTASCNACHEASKFGFLRVVRPSTNPFTNQDFRTSR